LGRGREGKRSERGMGDRRVGFSLATGGGECEGTRDGKANSERGSRKSFIWVEG